MPSSTLITDYVGRGTAAARPVLPNIPAGATAIYYETDTTNAFLWTGVAWVAIAGAGFTPDITSAQDFDLLVYDFASGFWKNQRSKYVIASYLPGLMDNNQDILYHRFGKDVTFPANFGTYLGATSEAGGTANATGNPVITIDQALTATPNTFANVGTITIAAGTVTPTFVSSGGLPVPFSQGDILRLKGPAVADATLAGFYTTLVGFDT